MLFSYMLFSALLITFSFAAPSYVPRDQAFIDWVKLLTEDGGIWKPSTTSKVQVETNIAQLTWTIVTGPKIYVDIQYKNKTTISNIDSQSLDPQTGPGADLATGVIWVQAGKAVKKPSEIQIISVLDLYWAQETPYFYQITDDPKGFINPNSKARSGKGAPIQIATWFDKAGAWLKKHL